MIYLSHLAAVQHRASLHFQAVQDRSACCVKTNKLGLGGVKHLSALFEVSDHTGLCWCVWSNLHKSWTMKADKSVSCLLMTIRKLFQGEHCAAERYLASVAYRPSSGAAILGAHCLVHFLFCDPNLKQCWASLSLAWGCESEPWDTDPCSILIHHETFGLCVNMFWDTKQKRWSTWCTPHRFYPHIIWWGEQYSMHNYLWVWSESDSIRKQGNSLPVASSKSPTTLWRVAGFPISLKHTQACKSIS